MHRRANRRPVAFGCMRCGLLSRGSNIFSRTVVYEAKVKITLLIVRDRSNVPAHADTLRAAFSAMRLPVTGEVRPDCLANAVRIVVGHAATANQP